MKIGILRAPHQNVRYHESTRDLLRIEVEIMLSGIGADVQNAQYEDVHGLELFTFVCTKWTEEIRECLQRVSGAQVVFDIQEGGLLRPLIGKKQSYFPEDLASILKYQGKTNETFTKMLVNLGVFSSRFANRFAEPLTVFDPMCGRGTTLYESLILGYNAAGIDVQKNEVLELNKFLLRYLKHNRLKHSHQHQNIVKAGKKAGVKYTVETAKDNEAYKSGDKRTIQYSIGDTRNANLYYKKNSYHTMVVDLPYGVQHVGRGKQAPANLPDILASALPEWHKLIKKGGSLVIAFNAMTLKRKQLAELLTGNGFAVLQSPLYDQMEHWVEQAVSRDVIIGLKE